MPSVPPSKIRYASTVARCIELLRDPAAPRAELRAQLRALKTLSRREGLSAQYVNDTVQSDGAEAPTELAIALSFVIDRMRAHGLRSLDVQRFAPATELLRLCQLLASEPGQQSADAPLADAVPLWSVRLVAEIDDDARAKADAASPAIARTQALRTSADAAVIAAARDELVAAAESFAARDDAAMVHAVVSSVAAAEREAVDGATRKAWGEIIGRMLSLPVVQLLVQHLPNDPDATLTASVLARAGENAGRALINHLMAAPTLAERRVYFDAIVSTRAGISMLIDALDDAQWYVIRNAASLLGHMRVEKADGALIALLDHEDDRVRKAAADALVMLGTPDAVVALQRVLRDPSPEMRRHAASVFTLGGREGGSRLIAPLTSALEVEEDDDVQIEILSALGRLATPDAVQRLLRAMSAGGAGGRPPEFRIAAVEALAQARGNAAVQAIRPLMQDAEPSVRDCAKRTVARLAQA